MIRPAAIIAAKAGLVSALLATLAAPAAADPMYPAAKCAAFWLGWTDAAKRLTYLDVNPADAELAARFRQAAIDEGGDPAEIDAFIKQDRRNMSLMVRANILGDVQSTDTQNRLMEICDTYAREHGF